MLETFDIHDVIGLIGVTIVLVTYAALQTDRIDAKGFSYSLLNGLGSGMIVYSLMFDFNLSAFVVDVAWVGISLFGVWKALTRKNMQGV